MKTLIEDYKRRLATITEVIKNTIDTGSRNDIAKMERLKTKQSEYRTFIAELEREYKSKFSAYDEVWVVQTYSGSGIDEIFTNEEDANIYAKERRDEFVAHYRNVNKHMTDEEWEKYIDQNYKYVFKVYTLDDAIDNVKDNVRDEIASQEDSCY